VPKRAERPTRSRRGVSLFEAVAAMAIVGMVAIAALEAVGAEMRVAERARRAVETAALAQSRLDWLDFLNETALRALPDSVKEGKFAEPLDEYSWKTEATPVSTQPGVYGVTIRVLWAKDGEFDLHSYVYRRPVITTGTAGGRGGRGGRGGDE
jgi:type II secretory pathway pseudopilin PulG